MKKNTDPDKGAISAHAEIGANETNELGLKAVDLFCGAGGISCGLRSAGFEVVSGVDMDTPSLSTFGLNFPKAQTLNADLSKISPADLMNKLDLQSGELDLLAGGPPCQGFSKNVPRKHRYLEDPRNLLIRTFVQYCGTFMPRLILMENVAEMRKGFESSYTQEIHERLERMGYSVTYKSLHAADYGVPQRRRRAFFVAARDTFAVPELPPATHTKWQPESTLFDSPFQDKHITVWNAIGDLPSLEHGRGEDPAAYASMPFSAYQELARDNGDTVSNHVARKLRPKQYERLSSIEPGQGLKDLPEHLQTRSGYSGAYGRLSKDMVAPTITRWVFHPGSGRFGHPVDKRVITIREAARLQAFPDSFAFCGTYTQQSHQVGNAVPPLLAKRVATTLLSSLV